MAMPDFNDAVLKVLETEWKQAQEKLRRDHGGRLAEFQSANLRTNGRIVAKQVVMAGATTGLGHAAQAAHAGVTALHVGALGAQTIAPIVWAIKPWTSAYSVANLAWDLEKMYALTDRRYFQKYLCQEHYACTCGERRLQAGVFWNKDRKAEYSCGPREDTHKTCKQVQDFIKEQKDAKAAKIAICATVVGMPFYAAYAAMRSIYKRANGTIHAGRESAAQHLARNAVPAIRASEAGLRIEENGCRQAQALIALIGHELELSKPNGTVANYGKTMSAMVHPDGWEMIAKAMSAGVIF